MQHITELRNAVVTKIRPNLVLGVNRPCQQVEFDYQDLVTEIIGLILSLHPNYESGQLLPFSTRHVYKSYELGFQNQRRLTHLRNFPNYLLREDQWPVLGP